MGLIDWYKDKKEEKEIKRQARKEAILEMRPQLKELIKEQEMKKMCAFVVCLVSVRS